MNTMQSIALPPEAISGLEQGPFVLVSAKQWNAMAQLVESLQAQIEEMRQQLEEQQDVIDIQEVEFNLATGKSQLIEMSPEELEAWVADDEKVPA